MTPSPTLSEQLLPALRRGLCRSLGQSEHPEAGAAVGRLRQVPGVVGVGPQPIAHLVGGPGIHKMQHLDDALSKAAQTAGMVLAEEDGDGGRTLGRVRLNPFLFDMAHFAGKNGEEGPFLGRVRRARQRHMAVAVVVEDLAQMPVAIQRHLVSLFEAGALLLGASTGTPFLPSGGLVSDFSRRITTVFATGSLAEAR